MESINLTEENVVLGTIELPEDLNIVNILESVKVPIRIHTDIPALTEKVGRLEATLKSLIPTELWTLDLQLRIVEVNQKKNYYEFGMGLFIRGEFLRELYQLCLATVPSSDFPLGEMLVWMGTSPSSEEPPTYFQYSALGGGNEFGLTTSIKCLRDDEAMFAWRSGKADTESLNFNWGVSISLSGKGFLELNKTLCPTFIRNWRILKTQVGDFTFVSKDGQRIPCHKVFLSESPVLNTMANSSKFEEGVKSEAQLDEMTAEGITALLEYLYCRVLIWAKVDARLAVELFQAAHKYLLFELEEEVKALILKMELELFDGKLALELFKFVRNYSGTEQVKLKNKVIEILRSLEDPIEVLEELFEKNSAAKEILMLALKYKE